MLICSPCEARESPPQGDVCNDHGLSFSLPSPTCQWKAADDPVLLTNGGMEIITNVSCGIGHKLIHTKYCTSGLSTFFLSPPPLDVLDKWKHPVGINWIWEQSPAGSTRTDKHPCLYPHLPPSHWHTQTATHLLILLYSSHALEKCLTPFQTHIFRHPHGSVSHTHMHTCARMHALPVSWSHCFHGSHVFCTCRMRQTGLSEGKETTPINSMACYWLTACSCTPICRARTHAPMHRVSTFLLGSPECSAVECDNGGSSLLWRAFTSRKGGDSITAPNTYLCLTQCSAEV